MNKKAFTIVELAIVLVVIGIILAMAVKGNTLVRAAQLKAEVNKLVKLEAVIYMYMVSNGGSLLMRDNQGGMARQQARVNMQRMIDAGYMSKDDVYSKFSNGYWTLTQCLPSERSANPTNHTNGYFFSNYSNSQTPISSEDWCASVEEGIVPGEVTGTRGVAPSVVCAIEDLLDDRSVTYGKGRRLGADVNDFTVINGLLASHCADHVVTPKFRYAYKVF